MNHKQFKKLLKNTQKLLRKHRKALIRYGVPVVLVLIAFYSGAAYTRYRIAHTQPKNIVWAIDATVPVPDSLKSVLMKRTDCTSYRGNNAPVGVGLWSVTQLEQQRYAKLTYGCSWSLSDHTVAVEQSGKWTVLKPGDYYADPNQGVPLCTAVVQYKIPPTLEGFCANDSGKLTKNPNPEM